MTTKDEALRLADSLERMSLTTKWEKQAAAELRRLYSVNQALLEALQELRYAATDKAEQMADAAIAKATGENT